MTRGHWFSVIFAGYLCLGVSTSAVGLPHGHAADTGDSKALDPVIACHAIGDSAARLTCYDDTVGSLQQATARHSIVVVDQAEVAKVRHSLFGFNVPSLNLFGTGKANASVAPEEQTITAEVGSARQDGDGNWIIVLQDGAIWHQTGGTIASSPRPGETVEIRRAALGSYFLRVGKQPGVKARREG